MSAMSVESPFVISPPAAVTTEWLLRAHQDSALVGRVSKEFEKAYASFSTVAEEHAFQTKKLQELLDATLAENKRLVAQNTILVEMCEKSTGQAEKCKEMLEEQKGAYEKELAECRNIIVGQADMFAKLEKDTTDMVHKILTEKETELAACKQQMQEFIAVATQKQEAFMADAEEQLKMTKCAVQAAAEARNEHLRADNTGLVAEVARLKGCLAALARPVTPTVSGTRHEL